MLLLLEEKGSWLISFPLRLRKMGYSTVQLCILGSDIVTLYHSRSMYSADTLPMDFRSKVLLVILIDSLIWGACLSWLASLFHFPLQYQPFSYRFASYFQNSRVKSRLFRIASIKPLTCEDNLPLSYSIFLVQFSTSLPLQYTYLLTIHQ